MLGEEQGEVGGRGREKKESKREREREITQAEKEDYLGFFFLSFSLPQEFCID